MKDTHKHDTGYSRKDMDRPDSPTNHPNSTAPANPGVGGMERPSTGGGGHGGGQHKAGGKKGGMSY